MTLAEENEKLKKENEKLKKENDELRKENKELKKNSKNQKKSTREPSDYLKFVKERFADVKKKNPEKKTPEIIKLIAKEWKETK